MSINKLKEKALRVAIVAPGLDNTATGRVKEHNILFASRSMLIALLKAMSILR